MDIQNKNQQLYPERIDVETVSISSLIEHVHRYCFASQFAKNKNILDIGCGEGYGSYILCKYGNAKSVVGVDVDEEAIKKAKVLYHCDRLSYIRDTAHNVDYYVKKIGVDYIVCFETLEHIENPHLFLEKLRSFVLRGGLLAISIPNDKTLNRNNPYHITKFDLQNFITLVSNHLKPPDVLLQHRYVEGSIIMPLKEKAFSSLISLPHSQIGITKIDLASIIQREKISSLYSNNYIALWNIEYSSKIDLQIGIINTLWMLELERWNKELSDKIFAFEKTLFYKSYRIYNFFQKRFTKILTFIKAWLSKRD